MFHHVGFYASYCLRFTIKFRSTALINFELSGNETLILLHIGTVYPNDGNQLELRLETVFLVSFINITIEEGHRC